MSGAQSACALHGPHVLAAVHPSGHGQSAGDAHGVGPHILPGQCIATSDTHFESHAVAQQYASAAHNAAAQLEHIGSSFAPVEHSSCAQPVGAPQTTPSQYCPTSLTHCESHAVLQQ
jgi:hypothetical protein